MSKISIPDINRRTFLKTLSFHLSKNAIAKKSVGLLIIDIRDFKRINRTFGFACGDQIIHDIFQRLNAVSQNEDCIMRIGNDEFAFMLPGLETPAYAGLAVNRLIKEMEKAFKWYDKEFRVDVCIGAAASIGDNLSSQELILKAEYALQNAKDRGLPFFLDGTDDSPQTPYNWELEKDLLSALKQNQLELFYQPKIDLKTGQTKHAEALLRWHSEKHGNIPPDQLVPIIERAGKMIDLTKWVLNTALRQMTEWPQIDAPLGVAVNIPANIVHERSLRDIIVDSLNIWGVQPHLLTLEITESAVIKDQQSSYNNLSHLKEAGVKISIDDFGTGYSSLEYFKNIPADELKIDKSFVFNMFNDSADRNIVQLIIDLAHKFNLSVVAEGIENEETLAILNKLDCDFAQGYFISRPINQQQFIQWLNNGDLFITSPD